MTMVPSSSSSQIFINQPQQQFYEGGGYGGDSSLCFMNRLVGYESFSSNTTSCLESDHQFLVSPLMAEDESRISSVNEEEEDEEEGGCSSSKDEKWLQLGVGSSSSSPKKNNEHKSAPLLELDLLPASAAAASSGGEQQQQVMRPFIPSFHQHNLLSTDLTVAPRHPFSNTTTSSSSMAANLNLNINTPIFIQHPRFNSLSFPQYDQVTWAGYNRSQHPWAPSSSSSSQIALGTYYPRTSSFQHHHQSVGPSSSSSTRIIDPPRRPDSNIWFSLEASQNQNKEPFLPQIPKRYLRIKDGRMTVQVLIKYLATKLRLDSESEVEIRCRNQQLEPSLTLQHVRDTIWITRAAAASNSSSTKDYVMILQYGWRTA